MLLIRTKVGPSRIHGSGLFAVDPIIRGAPIWRFQRGFDQVFLAHEFGSLPLPARDHTRWYCFVSGETGDVILSGDHACFLNHSSTPNTGAYPGATGPIATVALRDIEAGEELTCNYWAYDADTPWKLGLVPPDSRLGHGW